MSMVLLLRLAALVLTSAIVASAEAAPPPEPPAAGPAHTEFARSVQQGRWLSTFGLHASLGLAFGGETLAELTYADGSTSSVRGGEGVSLMGGVTWTPLWFGDRVGLGLGFEAGWKFKGTSVDSDGSVALERFPLVASFRNLIGFGKSWHSSFAVGGVLELSPTLSGDGVLSELDFQFDDAFGGMVELGVLWGAPRGAGYELTGRYTLLKYDAAGESLDASSGSINLALHFFL